MHSRSFFKRLDDLAVLLGMSRPHAHVGKAEPFQNRPDIAFAKLNAEAPLHHPLEIDAPPANHAVSVAIRPRLDDGGEFRQALGRQPRRDPAGMDVAQTIGALLVEAMHPITKCLAIHTPDASGVRPIHAVEHGGQRQQSPALMIVLGPLGQIPQIGGGIIGSQCHG